MEKTSQDNETGAKFDTLRAELDLMRIERDAIAQRQQRLAEVLNCPPEKIEHELRNVLNELKLLRTLFESQEKR